MAQARKERVQLALNEEEKAKLQALANANTGENMSLMIRKLIQTAHANPLLFGINPPKSKGPMDEFTQGQN